MGTYPFGKSKDKKGFQAFHAPFPDTFRQCNAIHFLPHHIQDQQFKIFPSENFVMVYPCIPGL